MLSTICTGFKSWTMNSTTAAVNPWARFEVDDSLVVIELYLQKLSIFVWSLFVTLLPEIKLYS